MLAIDPWWLITVIVALGGVFLVGRWSGAVNADRESFKAFMQEIRKDKVDSIWKATDNVREKTRGTTARLPKSSAVASESPLRLSGMGKRMRDQVGAGRIADQIAETLRDQAAGKSAYDIQELCFRYAREDWKPDAETEEAMKQSAYDNGSDLDEVRKMIAVEVRDRLLPEPPSDQPAP